VVRQADSAYGQARVKTRRAKKKQRLGKIGARRKRWLTWQNKTHWHRETGNTGINMPGTNGDNRRHLEVGGDNHKDR
jgi:hypothetical protein